MRTDHGTACEVFPVSYGSRYLDVATEATPAAAEVLPNVADATLLEIRHVMLSMITFMRKAHGDTPPARTLPPPLTFAPVPAHTRDVICADVALDGMVCEFVQSETTGTMLFHAVLGTQQPGKPASWTASYDAEGQVSGAAARGKAEHRQKQHEQMANDHGCLCL